MSAICGFLFGLFGGSSDASKEDDGIPEEEQAHGHAPARGQEREQADEADLFGPDFIDRVWNRRSHQMMLPGDQKQGWEAFEEHDKTLRKQNLKKTGRKYAVTHFHAHYDYRRRGEVWQIRDDKENGTQPLYPHTVDPFLEKSSRLPTIDDVEQRLEAKGVHAKLDPEVMGEITSFVCPHQPFPCLHPKCHRIFIETKSRQRSFAEVCDQCIAAAALEDDEKIEIVRDNQSGRRVLRYMPDYAGRRPDRYYEFDNGKWVLKHGKMPNPREREAWPALPDMPAAAAAAGAASPAPKVPKPRKDDKKASDLASDMADIQDMYEMYSLRESVGHSGFEEFVPASGYPYMESGECARLETDKRIHDEAQRRWIGSDGTYEAKAHTTVAEFAGMDEKQQPRYSGSHFRLAFNTKKQTIEPIFSSQVNDSDMPQRFYNPPVDDKEDGLEALPMGAMPGQQSWVRRKNPFTDEYQDFLVEQN